MKHTFICIGWIAVAIAAIYLRIHDLGANPIHFDEATGARLLGKMLSGEDPGFDPTHFHGPWLRQSTALLARLRGENDWASLTVETLRLSPALAGCLLCFTPLLWTGLIGRGASLAAGALLASSPLIVYYNRVYIHESWLAIFGMLACAGLYRFLQKPDQRNALLAGLSIGLMFATKETFAISILSWGAAALFVLCWPGGDAVRPYWRDFLKPAVGLCLWALLAPAFFYTDGFREPAAFMDAFRTFFTYETTSGHDKPFVYYLHLLIWPKQALGQVWSEGLIAVLAMVALPAALRKDTQASILRFIAVAFMAHLLIYSSIVYKTPWLMLLAWAHLCLLAGMAFQTGERTSRAGRIVLTVLLVGTLGWQGRQSLLATGAYANDTRNPYAYVPTSQNLQNLPQWLEALSASAPLEPAAVVGKGYWPLPWYLRKLEYVGYWPDIQPQFRRFAVIFVMPEQVPEADRLLENSHQRLPRGLRENVAVMMYLRNDIWKDWIGKDAP